MALLRIVIVGAGIGGLAAGIGLARNSYQVTIYERSTSTSEVSYVFRITPNSD
jgi:salicylate hydroxylase